MERWTVSRPSRDPQSTGRTPRPDPTGSHPPAATRSDDLAQVVRERCCRSPRVWVEPQRLAAAYRTWGGSLPDAAFLASLPPLGALITPTGLIAGIGLVEDWTAEDGGTWKVPGQVHDAPRSCWREPCPSPRTASSSDE